MKKNLFKKIVFILSFCFIIFGYRFVFADEITPVSIHLKIISGENSLIDSDVVVSPCDSDNNPETPSIITAYCAINNLKPSSVWDWSWAPSAFLTSIDDIAGYTSKDKDGNDVYHYWSWSLNGEMAMSALNEYELKSGDIILLEFIDPKSEVVVPPEEEKTDSEVPTKRRESSASGSIPMPVISFSLSNAINFLSVNQESNGSFGEMLYTDWVAIAVAKTGDEAESLKNKISNYLKNENFQSPVVTDIERHAMALMSFCIDPYTGTNTNYIDKIISSFDGTQLGDASLYSDDIFGLIVLSHAGYNKDDEIIKKIVSYVIKNQSGDGSWGSVDMTSAAIEALRNFKDIEGVNESISKGEEYLIKEQKDDGSFGNSFSTSWAVQSLLANNSFSQEVDNGIKYLSSHQQVDGGLEDNGDVKSRIWATSYGIPAILKLSWNDILESFEKNEKLNIKTIESVVVSEKKETQSDKIQSIKPVVKKEKTTSSQEEIKNNSMTASAVGPSQNNNEASPSFINKTIKVIKFPFVWFWVNWVYLL